MGDSADSIVVLYREHTQLAEPSDELVAQLLALLEPGERVLFTCGWTQMSEKWGPPAQLTVTTRRIVEQRWVGEGAISSCAPPRVIALRDVLATASRARGAPALFSPRALVVALADGTTLLWEDLTGHQIEFAVATIEAALEDLA